MIEFAKKLKSYISAPRDIMSHFHIEIDRFSEGIKISAGGVNAILNISDTEARLRCEGAVIKIGGEKIEISVYENKTVEISGKVNFMELQYDKN